MILRRAIVLTRHGRPLEAVARAYSSSSMMAALVPFRAAECQLEFTTEGDHDKPS